MWTDSVNNAIFDSISAIAQAKLDINLWENTGIDPVFVLKILGGIIVFVILLIVATLRYQRWKKYNDFVEEMKALDLDPDEEGTLAAMVKRIQMDEPVNILFSARLFDEMAASEIMRVLGSPAPAKVKEKFIEQVYNIRTRTYHPDWIHSLEGSHDAAEDRDWSSMAEPTLSSQDV